MTSKERAAMQQALGALEVLGYGESYAAIDLREALADREAKQEEQEHKCKDHPDAPHGFARNASHNAGRYVCECEGWEPDQAEQEPVAQVVKSRKTFNVYEAIVDTGNKLLAADTKLYAAPVRTVDLTDDEIRAVWLDCEYGDEVDACRAVIEKFKEKNK